MIYCYNRVAVRIFGTTLHPLLKRLITKRKDFEPYERMSRKRTVQSLAEKRRIRKDPGKNGDLFHAHRVSLRPGDALGVVL